MSNPHTEHKQPKITKFFKTIFYNVYADLYEVVLLGFFAFRKPEATLFYALSLLFTLVCSIFWIISFIHFGNSYSEKDGTINLATDGIYSKIRHPMYFFSSLALFFIVFYLNSLLAYLLLTIIIIAQIERTKEEDKMLEHNFGRKYIDYKEQTWF
jgi:protein-S-isoprenylcysteine O-methyltransferase Ste14